MSHPKLDFDIDRYLNPYVPRNRLDRLPTPISWFLGHRSEARTPVGSIVEWLWAALGAFLGLLLVEAVFQAPLLRSDGVPIVFASFGAAAILEYHTISSPLAQPRPALLGQLLCTFVGVSVTKLFLLSPSFSSLRWVAGALAVAISSFLMGVTKTVHPPAGATALLCATDTAVINMGWLALPVVGLGTVLLLIVALIVNNIQRTWPIWWWTPAQVGRTKETEVEKQEDDSVWIEYGNEERVVVCEGSVVVPRWLHLKSEERVLLEHLRLRLIEIKGGGQSQVDVP